MRILMFTNTFTPHVGGVARSVQQFSREFRRLGHQILIVAPMFPDVHGNEQGVVRIPAMQRFNGTDFSVPTPIPGFLTQRIDEFRPDIIHSHHPFLLGDTALRVSSSRDVPIVFTHHTQYERYTHYVPGDSEAMKTFVVDLAVGYCNLCDAVIAPSHTIRRRLADLGVITPIEEIPTGVDTDVFHAGNGSAVRRRFGIADSDLLIGYVGRLAPEKGLDFLAVTVARFVASKPTTKFLVAGVGPSAETIEQVFEQAGVADRLIMLGTMERAELADIYAAMDVFAFSSQSETQGMVLTEAMAASTPVVAVDASGVREVLRDGVNGFMLAEESEDDFVAALDAIFAMSLKERRRLIDGALQTAADFSMTKTAEQAIALYRRLIKQGRRGEHGDDQWSVARRRLSEEWKIWSNVAHAASHAVLGPQIEDRL
jgi:glycosyltransferase involved in cell wall biosynthesis